MTERCLDFPAISATTPRQINFKHAAVAPAQVFRADSHGESAEHLLQGKTVFFLPF